MLIDLSILVKFVLWGSIKAAMTLPRHSGNAMNNPTDHDNILHRLPYAHNVNPYGPKENAATKS